MAELSPRASSNYVAIQSPEETKEDVSDYQVASDIKSGNRLEDSLKHDYIQSSKETCAYVDDAPSVGISYGEASDAQVTKVKTGVKFHEYSTAQAMMRSGSSALHRDVAAKLETAMGKPFPSVEVRFEKLCLTADIAIAHELEEQEGSANGKSSAGELPTLTNTVVKSVSSMFSKKHKVRKHILKDVTGSFRPGTMTLVIGPGGSGKSALLKVLSGRFPMDKSTNMTGNVSYNGLQHGNIRHKLPRFVSYVPQSDEHHPTLTVQETLEFAHKCCGDKLTPGVDKLFSSGSPEENKQALEAAKAVVENAPEVVIRELGLEICKDTFVGNQMLRGISGGEKKRVTTGEMELGLTYVALMDEISTGLDSAAAYDIINMKRSMAKNFHQTVVISLLQPSPEIFGLFDDVLVMNEGRIMYHGPCSKAEEHFNSLGFERPPHRDLADFLCDLGTKQQYQYETGRFPAGTNQQPRSANEFASLYLRSDAHQRQVEVFDTPISKELERTAKDHIEPLPEFQQSFLAGTWALTACQMKLILRNKEFLAGRAFMVIIVGLIYASLFWQVDMTDMQVSIGVVFANIVFMGLGQVTIIPMFFDNRAIFYKQRAANFYRTSSYVLASSLSLLPTAIIETGVFGSMLYWMAGLVSTTKAFLLFELNMLLTVLVFLSLCFFLAAATPNYNVAKPLSMLMLLFLILYGGFIIARADIPDYFIWIYWIDPLAWTTRSILVSQYRTEEYDQYVVDSTNYFEKYGKKMGEHFLSLYDVPDDEMWIWWGIVFMAGVYLLFCFLSWILLEYYRYEQPEHVSLQGVEVLDEGGNGGLTQDYRRLETPHKTLKEEDDTVVDVTSKHQKMFSAVTVAFDDLWYTVPLPKKQQQEKGSTTIDLLKGITGYAAPYSMTALMGSTGAGKTTLMDVIACRKTQGTIQGKILLNGHEADRLSIQRSTGYCEQVDAHSDGSTFREALTFSALLRQGTETPDSHKYDSVDECLKLLGMEDIADQIIRGSSAEQMKRLTIGVELAAQPSVLFLDEPTSGLDARSAKMIMDGVRKVADSGRTVLCTIHQPSKEVFQLFDRLLLLKRGGETAYFGDIGVNSCELIKYFEGFEEVPRIPEDYNPATWMLEVIGAGVGRSEEERASAGSNIDFVSAFKNSDKKAELDEKKTVPGMFVPASRNTIIEYSSTQAESGARQFKMLLGRFFTLYWRTPDYNLTRLVFCIFVGLLFGLTFLNAEFDTYQDINGAMGILFLATSFMGTVSMISIMAITDEDRMAYYRERSSQTYKSLWYFLAFSIVEIPYVLLGALLFTAIMYPMIGFPGFVHGVYFWLITAYNLLTFAYFGQLFVFLLPALDTAIVLGMLITQIFFMTTGFNRPASSLPAGYEWVHAITPQRYIFGMYGALIFGDCSDEEMILANKNGTDPHDYPLGCRLMEQAPQELENASIKTYVDEVFDCSYDDIPFYLIVFTIMTVVLRLLGALALRFVNHQKR